MKNGLIFIIIFIFFACSKDVVRDHTPVNSEKWRTNLVAQLRAAESDEERTEIMQESGVRLTSQLVKFLRAENYKCPIDTIIYRYGNGHAKNVASGNGKTYDGKFNSEPYAVVKGGDCFKDSLCVFILCFNGTFELESNDSKTIGYGTQIFTIEAGKGINNYVDYKTSIALAETFHLPIYKGKVWSNKNLITPKQALDLENELGITKVMVRVFPGDRFDLKNNTLNGKRPK